MAYERGWFCPERGNWPDLRASRGDAAGRPFLHAWCHGGPGIGLGRLASAPHVDDDAIGEEVAAAVATTLDQGFGQNHSLCHGDLGNLDLLWKASHPAAGMAARILAGIERGGWRCGVGVRTEVPGLMVGLAGIGYGLLRAAAPATTPSVLLLETPAAADKRAKPTAL